MFTDTAVDSCIDAHPIEDTFSESLGKPHVVIPRAWRVLTWLVIVAMVLQLPAPALVRANARRVVQQPVVQLDFPFKAVNLQAPVLPKSLESQSAISSSNRLMLHDELEEEEDGNIKVYDSPTGVTLGTPIQFPGGGTQYDWITAFGGVSSLTLEYSGSMTFGACVLDVDWSSNDLGGGQGASSFFDWLLDVLQNTIDYTYDPLNRLTNVSYDEDGPTYHYVYDNVGNRTVQQVCPVHNCINAIEYSYSYDDANRLTSVNSQSYTWDNNGSLLYDGIHTYTYDYANHLVSVGNPQLEILNQYNGDGLRVGATVNDVATHYTYDVNTSLPVVLAETQDESIVHYYYSLGMVAQRTENTWSYPLHDALGSTRQATDDEGKLTASYLYDPFGVSKRGKST